MFPLYINNKQAVVGLTDYQQKSLSRLLVAIENNNLRLVENNCLCGNNHPKNDIVVSEKDRYGIPCASVLCSKCGLIRSDKVFDEKSNNLFYEKFYRDLYVGQHEPNDKFFKDQVIRGEKFLSLVIESKILDNISNVVEIGCGSGGIIYPFYKENKNCKGFDYNDDYLKLGRKFGLNLILGDWNNYLEDNSADLIIISHVMEHFLNPIKEINKIIKKIKPGKYLLVEVPGIFYINKIYLDLIFYLQNAHVYSFYEEYLEVFFKKLGLEVVYGDERCTFLLKKPENWTENNVSFIYDNSLDAYSASISNYLLKTNNSYNKFKYLNIYYWKRFFYLILDKIGLVKIVQKFIRR